MRPIVGISLVLLGIGTWSCQLEGLSARSPVQAASLEWVRTVDGWERPGMWTISEVPAPRLHPMVVAIGEILLSVFVLAACCPASPSGETPQ